MNTDYLVLLCLYLSSLVIRTIYELIKKAGRVNPKNPVVFGLIFTVMGLMWVSWFSLCPLDPLRFSLPAVVRWSALGVVIAGWFLAIGGVVQLRGVENITHLVTSGLYSKLRHPIYTGFILWILGWAVFNGSVVSFIAGCVGIGNILYWRDLEEKNLESGYGDVYREYRRKAWF
jgi:protein-S-isoprenylcysteine O-methyltransferase Ste14